MSELLTCPFCGGEASMESGRYQLDDDMYAFAHVECLSCGACGSGFTEEESPVEEVELLAADAWNRRAERTCRMEYNERGSHDEYYPTECYNCSECGHMTYDGVPTFCPNCGAKVTDE